MQVNSVVHFKLILPDVSDLIGTDMNAVTINIKAAVNGENGIITALSGDGRCNVIFPEYGAEQYGIHVSCFDEVGLMDIPSPDEQGDPTVTLNWYGKFLRLFGIGA
jgi:hypothetical protein